MEVMLLSAGLTSEIIFIVLLEKLELNEWWVQRKLRIEISKVKRPKQLLTSEKTKHGTI